MQPADQHAADLTVMPAMVLAVHRDLSAKALSVFTSVTIWAEKPTGEPDWNGKIQSN